jgi:hypothetical protein
MLGVNWASDFGFPILRLGGAWLFPLYSRGLDLDMLNITLLCFECLCISNMMLCLG